MIQSRPLISQEVIFKKISQEQLFEFYTGVSSGLINAPYRDDKKRSCSIFRHNDVDIILFKDQTTGQCGNIFNLVALINKISYSEAIYKVYKDIFNGSKGNLVLKTYPKSTSTSSRIFTLTPRQWDKTDLELWKSWGISQEILEFYCVSPVGKIYLDNFVYWISSRFNPIYKYQFGKQFKAYRPLSPKGTNWTGDAKSSIIVGWDQLPQDKLKDLIITKSLKDVCTLRGLGYWAISPMAESVIFDEETIEKIKTRASNIYLLFDYDYTGIHQTNYLKKYGFNYFFMSTNRHERRLDVSDYYKKFGECKTRLFLQTKINKYEKEYLQI